MRTLRLPTRLLLLAWPLLGLAGCASTRGVAPKIKTVASVGDRALPVVTGTPGNSVAADRVRPERRVSTNGRLSGRVVDDRGEPVPNVRVRLAVGNAPGGRMIRATTDASGAFTLHGLRPGSEYTVIAEHEDNQGLLTGRADARAPDTDVQISLKADDGATSLAGAGSRVSPVSNREDLDDAAADREDPAGHVHVSHPQLGGFAPAQPGLHEGLHEQPCLFARQCGGEPVELLRGKDAVLLDRDRR